MKKLQQKIYAFIDSQNLHLAIRNCGWQLDFQSFFVYLKDKHKVAKTFLFIGYIKKYQNFYAYLKKIGYIIIFKPTLHSKDGKTKGNVDAELVLHAMIEYSNYDKAIIISGDGDFYCLIRYLKEQGKLLAVGIPNREKYSALLRGFFIFCFFISNLRNKLEYKKEEGHNAPFF